MRPFVWILLAGLILGILFSLQPTRVGGQEPPPAEGPEKPATAPPAAEPPPADPNKPAAAEFSQRAFADATRSASRLPALTV